MAIQVSKSHGQDTQSKVRRVLVAILDYADGEVSDTGRSRPMVCRWADDGRLVVNDALVNTILHRVNADKGLTDLSADDVKRSFGDWVALQIFTDLRGNKTRGASLWRFDLKFRTKERQAVLAEFDRLWEEKWPPEAKRKPVVKQGLEPTSQVTKLPHNVPTLPPSPKYVARPKVLAEVKQLLLAQNTQPVVVRGLGGLGKSLLAASIARDEEILEHFEDGVLWVTLGQKPTNLQADLGGWIEELDKSGGSYSASTLPLAKSYLRSLLLDKRMLLVIDDVWNVADAEWFRVGGAGCRMLVITRTAFIPDAELYPLPLMDLGESVELMKGEIGAKWQDSLEEPIREFAKLLGCLPLAMKLMAVQVVRGLNIDNLTIAFLKETKRLSTLDYPRMKLEDLSDDQRREYSLRACFGLSLKWLEPELLERFIWLGILPEDIAIQQKMAMTLWDAKEWKAEEAILSLYESSLLMEGGETLEGNRTYRVHDLLHELAKELIGHSTDRQALQNEKSEVDALPGFGLTLPQAHEQLLERYKRQIDDCRWDKLPNDGYVHRHLTWHMEQSGWTDAVHELMAMSDDRGRNAWFEACEEIGEIAVFVQDVKRGWELAEKLHERDKERAIVLQGRYALLTSTMNLLTESLPPDLIAGFVHRGFWSVERAWAYVEQIQDERKIDNAISWIAPYLSKNLWQSAIQKAEQITNYCHRANAFSALLDVTDNCLDQAMELEQLMEDSLSEQDQNTNDPLYQLLELSHQKILLSLSKIKDEYFQKALKSARQNSKLVDSAASLIALSEINNYYLDEALEATELVADKVIYAHLLVDLAKIELRYCDKAFEVVCLIKEEANLVDSLGSLINIRHNLHVEVSRVAKRIQNIFCRVRLLAHLANIEPAYLDEALATLELASKLSQLPNLESVGDSYQYTLALIFLTNLDASYFPKALDATILLPKSAWCKEIALRDLYHIKNSDSEKILSLFRLFNGSNDYASVIVRLAKVDERFFSEALDVANLVHDNCIRASLLAELAENNKACLDKALKTKRLIQNSIDRARISVFLARIEKSYFWEALEDTKSISVKDENIFSLPMNQDERRWNLISLVYVEDANFSQILEVAQLIHDEDSLAWILVAMSRIDPNYSPQAIQAIRSVQNLIDKARVLGCLAAIDSSYFSEALETAQSIQGFRRARALSDLASINNICFEEALNIAQSMQKTEGAKSIDEEEYASVLGSLAIVNNDIFQLALEATREIRFIPGRIRVINQLINNSPDNYVNHLHDIIAEIPSISDRSQAFSSYLPRLPLANLPHPDWKSHLHLLAHRKRADLMGDLVTLYPAILHLGGEGAMRGIVAEMRRVCEQWP